MPDIDWPELFKATLEEVESLVEQNPERCRQLIQDMDSRCRQDGRGLPLPFLVDYLRSLFAEKRRAVELAGAQPVPPQTRRALYDAFIDGFDFAQTHAWMMEEWPDGWEEYVRPKIILLVSDIGDWRPDLAEKLRQQLWEPNADEAEILGPPYDVDDPAAAITLFNRLPTLVSFGGEEEILDALAPVANLWHLFVNDRPRLSSRPASQIEQIDRCLAVVTARMDAAPDTTFFGISLDKLRGVLHLVRGVIGKDLGAPVDLLGDSDRFLDAYGGCPAAVFLAWDNYAALGKTETVQRLFDTIDPRGLDAEGRENYREMQQFLRGGGGLKRGVLMAAAVVVLVIIFAVIGSR